MQALPMINTQRTFYGSQKEYENNKKGREKGKKSGNKKFGTGNRKNSGAHFFILSKVDDIKIISSCRFWNYKPPKLQLSVFLASNTLL